ncbi:MAG TPA: alpha-E domain-containing protein [Rubrivivax sp.]|nr:alpha-E domain-containing protein [Rubrivivax sp.]
MLFRTADHLFWMSRYMERADNAAAPHCAEGKTRCARQRAAVFSA